VTEHRTPGEDALQTEIVQTRAEPAQTVEAPAARTHVGVRQGRGRPVLPKKQSDSRSYVGNAASIARKIAHKADAVEGGAKMIVGGVTGNRCLQAEGRGVAGINERF
jgi:hypothetical protein